MPEARATLLPLVEAADVTHKGLWAIVGALQQHPDVRAEPLLAEIGDSGRRAICWPSC